MSKVILRNEKTQEIAFLILTEEQLKVIHYLEGKDFLWNVDVEYVEDFPIEDLTK